MQTIVCSLIGDKVDVGFMLFTGSSADVFFLYYLNENLHYYMMHWCGIGTNVVSEGRGLAWQTPKRCLLAIPMTKSCCGVAVNPC